MWKCLAVAGALALAASFAACDAPAWESTAPAPGYSGPLPSVEARTYLDTLAGRTFDGAGTSFAGGAPWTIRGFGVVPNEVTGKGPVLLLERPDPGDPDDPDDVERHVVPLETDGDVADLYRRVTGEALPFAERAGATSAAYRAAMGEAAGF